MSVRIHPKHASQVVRFSEQQEAEAFLRANQSNILRVEKDYRTSSFGNWQPGQDNIRQQFMMDFNSGEPFGPTGMGILSARGRSTEKNSVTIAVLDSGHYPNDDIEWYLYGYDFTERNSDTTDRFTDESGNTCFDGHGISVSSVIGSIWGNGLGTRGVLSSDSEHVNILPVRVTGYADQAEGFKCTDFNVASGWLSDKALAIRWLAGDTSHVELANIPPYEGDKVQFINMSVGGITEQCPAYLQEAIDVATRAGIQIIAAAGNGDHTGSPVNVSRVSPANCDGVIAVTSLAETGLDLSFSNRGSAASVSAQGEYIPALLPEVYMGMQYYDGNGTSLSAPLVTGIMALAYQDTGIMPNQAMTEQATNPYLAMPSLTCERESDRDDCLGYGVLDAEKLLTIAQSVRDLGLAFISHGGNGELPCPARIRHEELARVLGNHEQLPRVVLASPIESSLLEAVNVYELRSGVATLIATARTGNTIPIRNYSETSTYLLEACFSGGCYETRFEVE